MLIGGLYVHEHGSPRRHLFRWRDAVADRRPGCDRRFRLRRPIRNYVHPDSLAPLATLGVRNAARNRTRSLSTTAMIASAAFLIVAVESFRRQSETDFRQERAGSGGFVSRRDRPASLSRPRPAPGRQDILDALEKAYQTDPATKPKRWQCQTFFPFRPCETGDDASCLNLYRPGRPRIVRRAEFSSSIAAGFGSQVRKQKPMTTGRTPGHCWSGPRKTEQSRYSVRQHRCNGCSRAISAVRSRFRTDRAGR